MWIDNKLVGWKCSNCGEHIVFDAKQQGNFCPVCGFHHNKEIKWLPERTIYERTTKFASSGSCGDPILWIYGKVINDITFVSDEFTSTMDGQHFWDELAELAKTKRMFIELRY